MKIILNLMLLSAIMWSASFAQDIPAEPLPEMADTTKSDTLSMLPDTLGEEAASEFIGEETPSENEPEAVTDADPNQQDGQAAIKPDQTDAPPADEMTVPQVKEAESEPQPAVVAEKKVEVPPKVVYDPVKIDTTNYFIGMRYVPFEVSRIWRSIMKDPNLSTKYPEYLAEGVYAISQLGDMVMSLNGIPPEPGMKHWAAYEKLHTWLMDIVDMVQLAIILDVPEFDSTYTVQELETALEKYQAAKKELASNLRSEEQNLTVEASKLLMEQKRDPYYLQYPHRRNVIAHLYFRQTELVLKETEEAFGEEYEAYFEKLASLLETDPDAASRLRPPEPNYAKVKAMYRRITEEFPTSLYADDALYNLAYLTSKSGQPDAANRLFTTFLRLYPNSEYTLNVLRRVGGYYFDPPVNDPETAIKYYKRITNEFADSTKYYIEGLYFLGWCYYRTSEMPTAVEYFAQTLDNAYATRGALREDALRYEDDAIQYIGICFSVDTVDWKGAGVDNLVKWLEKHPERMDMYGREIVIRLGNIYNDQMGLYAKAIDAYDRFVEFFGNDPRGPEVQQKVVEIFREGRVYNPDRAHEQKIVFFNDYNPDSEWWQVNTDSKIREKVAPILEQYLNEYIDETRVTAYFDGDVRRAVPKVDDIAMSQKYGRQYIRFWPNGPNVYKIHADLAVDLEQLDKKVEAIREYWQVARAYEDTSKKELAAMRVVAIAQEFVNKERGNEVYVNELGELLPPDQKPMAVENPEPEIEPVADDTLDVESAEADSTEEVKQSMTDDIPVFVPLLHSEEMLLAGFDMYIDFFPATDNTPVMLYRAGELLDHHNSYAGSRPYFEKLIAEYPDHRFVESAWGLMLEGHFKSKEYMQVEDVARRISEADVSDALKDQAYKRKAAAILGNAQNLQAQEDYLTSAAEFVRVAMEAPDVEFAHQMLYQGGLTYVKGKDYEKANDAFSLLVERYPASQYANKALYYVGLNQQNFLGKPIEAARTFEQLVAKYPKSEFVQGALRDASYNFGLASSDTTLENHKQYHNDVIRVNEKYISLYPNAEDANAFLFENATHYLALDRFQDANDIYQRYAQRYPDDPITVRAFFERGKYYHEHDNRRQAANEFRATVEAHDRLTAMGKNVWSGYAARSLSLLLEWEHEEYDRLRFNLPEANLRSAKTRKKDWRNALIDKYKKLVGFGSKEGYRAYYAIGRLDEELALATFEQELPTFDSLNHKLTVLIDSVVLPATDFNVLALDDYRLGMKNLNDIATAVMEQKIKLESEVNLFSVQVMELNGQDTTISISDSTEKLTNMKKTVTYLDSAYTEAKMWADKCNERIPRIAFRNGQFFDRFWRENFELAIVPERAVRELVKAGLPRIESQMLLREGLLNSIAPITPEAMSVHLQTFQTLRSTEHGKQWTKPIETALVDKIDSLLTLYQDQVSLAASRVDHYVAQYKELLTDPDGEDAKSKEGFYPDEYEAIILDRVEYFNTFTLDYIYYLSAIVDTISSYNNLPVGFAEERINDALQFVLDQYLKFKGYRDEGALLREEYTVKFDEEGEFHFDDAASAFEELELISVDYGLALLEEGLAIRDRHNVPGEAGIFILKELVSIDPEKYAERVGLSAESHVEYTNEQWKIYWEGEFDFELSEFDDSEWIAVSPSEFPDTVRVGIPEPEPEDEFGDDEFAEDDEFADEEDLFEESDTLAAEATLGDTILTDIEGETGSGEIEMEQGVVIDVDFGILDSLMMESRMNGDLEPDQKMTAIWHTRLRADQIELPEYPDTVNIDAASLSIFVDEDLINSMSLDELIEAGYSPDDYTPDMSDGAEEDAIRPEDLSGLLDDVLGEDTTGVDGEKVVEEMEVAEEMLLGTPEEVEAQLEAKRQAAREEIETAALDEAWAKLKEEAYAAIAERDSLLVIQAEQDAQWSLWNEPDENGVRTYWFRSSFDSADPPANAFVWLDGGEEYELYVNGNAIDAGDVNPDAEVLTQAAVAPAEDTPAEEPAVDEPVEDVPEDGSADEEAGVADGKGQLDEPAEDAAEPITHDIAQNLQAGSNTIAISVSSSNFSRNGLLFGLVYHTGERVEVVSSEDWLVSGVEEGGYESSDFDDSEWRLVMVSEDFFPSMDASTDVLVDELNAAAIWYRSSQPDEVILPIIPDTTYLDTFEVLLAVDTEGVDTLGQAAAEAQLAAINDVNYDKLMKARKVAVYREREAATVQAVEEERARLKDEWALIEAERAELEGQLEQADEIWEQWVEPDESGSRSYWFRRLFNIESRPSAGHIWLTADDDFNLYLNGEYLLADDQDSIDWMGVKEYDVGSYLRQGENLIALEVIDTDNTRHGLLAGLIYKTIPDMESALEQMVADQKAREEEIRAAELAAADERERLLGIKLTPGQMRDLRIIEKNKLR